MSKLTIGRVAQSSGVGVETVRFYERKGLIEQPIAQATFREYPPEVIERIQFIKRAQQLGFTLAEVKQLLGFAHKPSSSKQEVKQLAGRKLIEIRHKIEDLQRLESTLASLHEKCSGRGTLSGCPIIESIISPDKKTVTHRMRRIKNDYS
ncbi:MAG TPA: heavy metal-responsive transcriptional regulator [Planctomycetaceae bacterium]|nr:heavy metal-responsive transcriptional regulator [Planctomycetaceae bacterium]|tara:strand:- start:2586 stop:3035 length:450 start_codon:yes stop_codon:yes gene_type:complete